MPSSVNATSARCCANCGTRSSVMFRKGGPTGEDILCNPCAVYEKKYGIQRPKDMAQRKKQRRMQQRASKRQRSTGSKTPLSFAAATTAASDDDESEQEEEEPGDFTGFDVPPLAMSPSSIMPASSAGSTPRCEEATAAAAADPLLQLPSPRTVTTTISSKLISASQVVVIGGASSSSLSSSSSTAYGHGHQHAYVPPTPAPTPASPEYCNLPRFDVFGRHAAQASAALVQDQPVSPEIMMLMSFVRAGWSPVDVWLALQSAKAQLQQPQQQQPMAPPAAPVAMAPAPTSFMPTYLPSHEQQATPSFSYPLDWL